MNLKEIALGILGASLLASSASAQTHYYMFGSTAYRKATFDATKSLVNGTAGFSCLGDTTFVYPGPGGNLSDLSGVANSGANAWVMTGTIAGIGSVVIHGTWAGAVGGEAATAGKQSKPMLQTGAVGSSAVYVNNIPDVGMCDQQPTTVPSLLPPTPGFVALKTFPVCVVEFVVAANAGSFPADFLNVTGFQLNQLYTVGVAPLEQFTGNTADNVAGNSIGVYATGRDDDSGTRCTFQMDTGLGVPSSLSQYSVSGSPSYKYTAFPVAGINFLNDGGGYGSGSAVKAALLISNPGTYANGDLNAFYPAVPAETKSCIIGYLAVSDWNGSGLPALNYNGVAYSHAAIQQGQYSYWCTENANVRLADYNANTKTIQTFIADLTGAQIAQAGLPANPGTLSTTSMACTRAGDGQPILHN